MTRASTIPVKILVMERHFLYLPLYVAKFDLQNMGKSPFFGCVPPRYSVEVIVHRGDGSDQAVYDDLMSARLSSSDVLFAACDPTVLLRKPKEDARMIASVISSSAFWAVNHDKAGVRLVSDLSSFDPIICYREETTSHLIASRIAGGNKDKLLVVPATGEIDALGQSGEGALAISPELLQIANDIYGPLKGGEKRKQIVLELSTSKEFSNVLTTALLTRAEVINQHPDLVSGVLAALQHSLNAIYARDPMVTECARHNFPDPFCLEQALDIAERSNIFPETIRVKRDRWQRACEFYFTSQAMAQGKTRRTLTKRQQSQTEEIYEQAVLDQRLEELVTEAIRRGFSTRNSDSQAMTPDLRGRRWRWKSVLAALPLLGVGLVVGQAFAGGLSWSAFAVTLSWALMLLLGWLWGRLSRYERPSFLYAFHWGAFTLFWWGVHEIALLPKLPDASFFRGVELDSNSWYWITAVCFTYLVGACFGNRAGSPREVERDTCVEHER